MTKKISVILVAIMAVTLFWYLVGEVLILKDSKNSISKLQCVSYAPFSKDQSPFLFAEGMVISENQVREDLTLLSKYTDCIRTYSVMGLESVPKIAREKGMKMFMGGWVSSDKTLTEIELKALIKLATENQDIVKAIIVGNETLLRGEVTDAVLAGYIKDVKKALPNIQVTYADVWEFWLRNPEIQKATDFATIHILPYWEDDTMSINSAIEHVRNIREEVEVKLKDKNIVIGETGWPSEGRMREDALPSKINQAIYIRDFVKLAEEKGWSYNIIEAFDQPWKRVSEGAVGGFWGLFDKDRMDKHVFSGDVSNFPNYKPLAFGSIFLVLAFSLMLKNRNIQTKNILLFGVVNALFALLFMLQMEQYNVTVRTNVELVWAVLVSLTNLFIYSAVLYHIAHEKKPNIVNIGTILKQKIFSMDASLMLSFYLSLVFVLITTITLALEGRYRNFEVYVFTISIISYLWLYRGAFERLDFGKFEKASFIILVLSSITILVNEGFLNLFSNMWIIIALGFAAILYKGSKKIAYSELKNLALIILLFSAFFVAVRYGILRNSYFEVVCSTSLDSLICKLRNSLAVYVYLQILGYIAMISAGVALLLNKKIISHVALFLSILALVMFNTFFGSIAFVVVLHLLTKEKKYLN